MGLFPRPRFLERTSDSCSATSLTERVRLVPGLGAESYELEISPAGIEIRHADGNGLRYARQTLDQIRHHCGAELPGLVVRDGPDFPVRGHMLDVSRDRVPTRAFLERLVGFLARVRLNHLQLYTEHTFAYRGHEEVWRDASPMTAEDIVWLDGLCHENGIELSANQNAFGHMERWLKHETYRHLAETPEGWEAPGGMNRQASVLAPTDESFALVDGLFDELLPSFRSPRVNINCDETFELGKGRSKQAVDSQGRPAVYTDFLLRLLGSLHDRGKEALFWGDIVRQSPDQLARLPRQDTIALAWHYEAPGDPDKIPEAFFQILADFGIEREMFYGFRTQVASFGEADLPFWVCPGTSSWNSLVGRLTNARANLLDAAEHGRAAGATGYLITDWGDSGHLQPPTVSFPPLAYGAAVSWGLDANRDIETAAFLDAEIFQDDTSLLAGALETAGRVYSRLGLTPFNGTALHYQLLGGGLSFLAQLMGKPNEKGLGEAVEELDSIATTIDSSRPTCADADVVRREIRQAVRLARHGAWRCAQQAGFAAPSRDLLRRDLAEAIEEQRACWLLRSRPGGLADSLARLEGTLAEYAD